MYVDRQAHPDKIRICPTVRIYSAAMIADTNFSETSKMRISVVGGLRPPTVFHGSPRRGGTAKSAAPRFTSIEPLEARWLCAADAQANQCYLPGQPGDGTNAAFVSNLYREVLGRDADPAGQQAWTALLGGTTPASAGERDFVIQVFLSTPEYKQHLVNCVFQQFLHRDADPVALQFFSAQQGEPGHVGPAVATDERFLVAEIVGSDEYYALHGATDQGFIDGMYQDIFGRQADSGGEAYWLHQLNAWGAIFGRNGIALMFNSTDEAALRLLNDPGDSALAKLTGGGWNQLYFQGRLTPQAQQHFFHELQVNSPYAQKLPFWTDVIDEMLELPQYFDEAQVFNPADFSGHR